jgi:hypothetical protein
VASNPSDRRPSCIGDLEPGDVIWVAGDFPLAYVVGKWFEDDDSTVTLLLDGGRRVMLPWDRPVEVLTRT